MFNCRNLFPEALQQSTSLTRMICLAPAACFAALRSPLPRSHAPRSPAPRLVSTFQGVRCFVLLALAAVASAMTAISSRAAELPAAELVFQRHVAAIGGDAALRKPHNMVLRGEADLVSLKVKAPIEFFVEAPDRFLLRLKYHHAFFGMIRVPFVGVRQPECGYDGTNGWTIDFERRIEPMSSIASVPFRGLLDKFTPLYFSREFRLTRTLDIERFAGRDCYRVLVVFPSGEHALEYYDTVRGLLVGAINPFTDDGGSFNVSVTWSDYRRLRTGLSVPFLTDLEVFGDHYLLKGKEVRTDEKGFAIPASKCSEVAPLVATLKPDPKPAQEIIDRYLGLIGGQEAIRKHTSMHISGQLRFPRNKGFSSPIEIYSARTNRFCLQVQLAEGLHRQGCDGQRYWRATGTEVKFAAGKDLEQLLAMRDFEAELHGPGSYRSMETLGTIKVDGRTCYQLLLVRKSGEVFDEFYDAETGLLYQRRRADEGNGGSRELLETYDDYRRFGDQMVPVRQVFTALQYREELTISKVEWDNVPETVFEPPSDIKAAWERKSLAKAK